mmetsp:Transcript_17998/g.31495  ORF Transcript_17998/g.31495 Transcript_17998/m.31495 type:complete len:222 (-) Transcript_17998:2354-3019(-)
MQQINAKQMCSQHSCLSEVAASQEIFVVHTNVNAINFVQPSDVQIDQRQFKFTNAFAKVHMSVIVTQMNFVLRFCSASTRYTSSSDFEFDCTKDLPILWSKIQSVISIFAFIVSSRFNIIIIDSITVLRMISQRFCNPQTRLSCKVTMYINSAVLIVSQGSHVKHRIVAIGRTICFRAQFHNLRSRIVWCAIFIFITRAGHRASSHQLNPNIVIVLQINTA